MGAQECITTISSQVAVTERSTSASPIRYRSGLEEHRGGKGSAFVKQYVVFRLVHVEAFERAEDVIAREKQLKRWKRDWKIELIEKENLEWRDLSDLLV
jgi:putative endonuclease